MMQTHDTKIYKVEYHKYHTSYSRRSGWAAGYSTSTSERTGKIYVFAKNYAAAEDAARYRLEGNDKSVTILSIDLTDIKIENVSAGCSACDHRNMIYKKEQEAKKDD